MQLVLILLATIVVSGQVFAASRSDRAKALTAGVVRHIVQATEFPEGTFSSPDAALIFAVVGEDPFGSPLDKTFRAAMYRGRRIEIRRYANLESVMPCHVLFVASSEQRDLEALLALVSGLGVLTVGETEDFVTRGGMIKVRRQGRKVGYEVNQLAAQNEGISFSPKVLALATATPRTAVPAVSSGASEQEDKPVPQRSVASETRSLDKGDVSAPESRRNRRISIRRRGRR